VLDFDVRGGKVSDFRYRLLPVFANLLPAGSEMAALIAKRARAVRSEARRAARGHRRAALSPRQFQRQLRPADPRCLIEVKDAEIAFSPGFRWGTTSAAGQIPSRCEHLMDQTAITYPHAR
jgi:sulfur-oxidizing protein SoxB